MPCQMAGSKKTEALLLLIEEAKLMLRGGRVMPCQMAGSKKTESRLLLVEEAKLMMHGAGSCHVRWRAQRRQRLGCCSFEEAPEAVRVSET